ncbi:hypothetical protein B0T18DRAFT_223298 [Schizothecium vesticola]|uniref:Uncharacterized protein n=1 Tax=Schizothecium vesticola TaxID=314040 RepID=A0AA40EKK0_9PEZI|nr:hypothetical protein B0T18DRAFT_223298 [Schizothecium vesticola]
MVARLSSERGPSVLCLLNHRASPPSPIPVPRPSQGSPLTGLFFLLPSPPVLPRSGSRRRLSSYCVRTGTIRAEHTTRPPPPFSLGGLRAAWEGRFRSKRRHAHDPFFHLAFGCWDWRCLWRRRLRATTFKTRPSCASAPSPAWHPGEQGRESSTGHHTPSESGQVGTPSTPSQPTNHAQRSRGAINTGISGLMLCSAVCPLMATIHRCCCQWPQIRNLSHRWRPSGH